MITMVYVVNATLLVLHEMESAYVKEWEILKLPGKITDFLLLHIPIILLLFYGVIEIEKQSAIGPLFGVAFGVGGILPLVVHKVAVRKEGYFDSVASNAIIYANAPFGAVLTYLSIATSAQRPLLPFSSVT